MYKKFIPYTKHKTEQKRDFEKQLKCG